MKDYSYFIPGYTGFCPELREHFGQTYGHATRHIIREKPHLEDRLAPVFYSRHRSKMTKNMHGKYCDYENEKFDPSKMKQRIVILDPVKTKYRADCDHGDRNRERCHPDDGKGIPTRQKHGVVFEEEDTSKGKYRSHYDDGDRIRKVDHECVCPKFIYFEGYAGCMPEYWNIRDKSDSYYNQYPHIATPYMHLKEPPPEASRQRKDSRMGRISRVKPHRYGGVIPKYTGHIPGMEFSFGESYGPASDRLLRRHHDRMTHLKRKS